MFGLSDLKQGRFIENHRKYVELLRVLSDSTVKSLTLITSREKLCESGIAVELYRLPVLDEQAWQQFFSRRIQVNIAVLKAMHKAYGGMLKQWVSSAARFGKSLLEIWGLIGMKMEAIC